ncbi:uncharacterized protein K452DRAFT_303144 [Aplosporella prunicola CBS 121167]|uniref:Uncharacterized protein n=1 Tax=Aplosporella prunicola CBS 121167 TaxID=1176127 RepID=A0A6A6AVL8_9PEZI|nr:uncharacterized protein K452DRAFT_303144 [Aplosporella prunicola CBS 121167]KAF2135989.1 hypothetical protein K452DRAFT_303144 [Aplosporella prunicola CBS 121167]
MGGSRTSKKSFTFDEDIPPTSPRQRPRSTSPSFNTSFPSARPVHEEVESHIDLGSGEVPPRDPKPLTKTNSEPDNGALVQTARHALTLNKDTHRKEATPNKTSRNADPRRPEKVGKYWSITQEKWDEASGGKKRQFNHMRRIMETE